MVTKLLLVEDDRSIAEPLSYGLMAEGFEVCSAYTLREALSADRYDMVLLDLNLPDGDGLRLCDYLRSGRKNVPILIISARSSEVDKVIGLERGADDYLIKPFGFRELTARIRALLRRSGEASAYLPQNATATTAQTAAKGPRGGYGKSGLLPPVQVIWKDPDVEINRRSQKVKVAGDEVQLTPTEFSILALIAEDPGALCTRHTILTEIWGPNWYGATKMIDVHLASLRKKVSVPNLIETVRGVGFRIALTDGGYQSGSAGQMSD
ncbi:MAG: response regulator transcription factor [Firmicutes bacterium]|nr:response regulator transcription factor [Bacillota bacterium]